MDDLLQFTVYEGGRRLASRELQTPVELGRIDRDDPDVFAPRELPGCWRLPIASRQEVTIGRRQLLVEAVDSERVRLTNLSGKVELRILNDQSVLGTEAARTLSLPVHVLIGSRRLSIDPVRMTSLLQPPPRPRPDDPPQSILQTIMASSLAADRAIPALHIMPWVEAAMQIQSAGSEEVVLDQAVKHLKRLLQLDATAVLMSAGGTWTMRCQHPAMHPATDKASAEDASSIGEAAWSPSRRVLAMVASEGKTFWQLPEVCTGSIAGVAALIASPILNHAGLVIAILYGQRSEGAVGATAVTETHAMLTELLASAIAAALEKKQLLQKTRELEIGRSIQQSFLPTELPQPSGWQVGVAFQPARDVSGDFYDALMISPRHLLVVVADVCDKGVGSALYMTLFRSLIRAFAQEAAASEHALETEQNIAPEVPGGGSIDSIDPWSAAVLRHAVEKTNRYVVTTHGWQCMFCTLVAAVIDTERGELTYINAGHDEPIIRRDGGTIELLPTTGPAVGLRDDAAFEVATQRLQPGDCFVGYSDGIPDARNGTGEFFTRGRLLSFVANSSISAADLTEGLMQQLRGFIGLAEPHDDITFAVVVREP